MTSDLANRTLRKILGSQPAINGVLILHSDQGTRHISKVFIEFCESANIRQSMSKAGYSYDNAPIEHYLDSFKNECIKLYKFRAKMRFIKG